MTARPSLRPVNDADILAEIDRRTQGHGAGERLAKELGVESSHLREMKSGRRPPSRKAARGLGWELRWVKANQEKKAQLSRANEKPSE